MTAHNSSQNEKPVIETIRLTKVFKDFWHRDKVKAVNNLTLKIYPGEVYGLLGPNGSGKTTTLKIMLGLLFPSSGMVRIFGHSPRNVSVKSRIGFLPEESYFYRHLSARETMNFYGALFEIPSHERRKRSDKLLELLGLLSSQNRQVGEYSKGMARRIGLAQTLINDPDLIILDEPTSGLDPIGRREVKNIILQLKKMGKTVLLSSHLLSEVQDVCDRICILYGGEKIAEGRVDEVLVKKNIMQFHVSSESAELVDRARSFFREEIGGGRVRVSNPVESLEEFFLREIRTLERKKEAAPAEERKPAEKLSVIERLMKEEPAGEALKEEEPPQPSGEKPAGVLKSLVKDDNAEQAAAEKSVERKEAKGEVLKKLARESDG